MKLALFTNRRSLSIKSCIQFALHSFLVLHATAQIDILDFDVEVKESVKIDRDAGDVISAGNEYNQARRISAEVAPGKEGWIPLGVFVNGAIHKLSINATGGSTNSALVAEFAVNYNNNNEVDEVTGLPATNGDPIFYSLSQHSAGSQFRLYYYKEGRYTGLALRYTNTNSSRINYVTALHTVTLPVQWSIEEGETDATFDESPPKWRLHNPTNLETNLTSLSEEQIDAQAVISNYEQHTVATAIGTYGQQEGIYFNGEVTFNAGVNIPAGAVTASSIDPAVFTPYMTTETANDTYLSQSEASSNYLSNQDAVATYMPLDPTEITTPTVNTDDLSVSGDATVTGHTSLNTADINSATIQDAEVQNALSVGGDVTITGQLILNNVDTDIPTGIYGN